jgi:hypothetical protein
MRRDSQALLYQARLINKQIDNIFTKFDEKFKGKDPALFTEDDRSDFTKEIEDGLDALDTYADLATELDFLFTGTLDKATENLRDEIYKTSARSKLLRSNLLRLDKNFTNDFIAMSEKVKDAKKGEKSVNGLVAQPPYRSNLHRCCLEKPIVHLHMQVRTQLQKAEDYLSLRKHMTLGLEEKASLTRTTLTSLERKLIHIRRKQMLVRKLK